jgi:type VI secretion system protein ImpC
MVAESAPSEATSYPPTSSGATGTAADDLAGFVRRVVRRHLVADPDPRQAELVAGVDRAVAAQLRDLLRDPSFRALESAWRTVERLARRVETSTSLRLYLLDVSADELDGALNDQPDGAVTELARLLARAGARLPDGGRWSALVVLRTFGADEYDHARLARLGMIARALAATAFVDVAPSFAGLESWRAAREARAVVERGSPTLAALRASPAATWLCAAAPRVLLREPYGADGEPVESFAFEELADDAAHDHYLWGSGGAVCALLLAQSFEQSGWSLRPGEVRDLNGLPLPMRVVDGEREIVPCAETLLTEEAAERMQELGITPIATMRNTDTAHVVRFQSLASPPTALAGPWLE